MKFLYCLFFALTSSFSTAQPYISMLEEGNAWSVAYFDVYQTTTYKQFNLGENILINGIEYKTLLENWSPLNCFVREENEKVFILHSSGEEKVLLDFNLIVGDIFVPEYISCIPGPYLELEVISVYTDFIAGEDRKVIELEDDFNSQLWIEGIGSNQGGIYIGESNLEGGSLLNCFSLNGETFLFNNATTCFLGVDEYLKSRIILSPNPVSSTSILELPSALSIDRIIILDIHGRVIKNEILTKEYYTIDVIDYRSGMFFYQVFSNEKVIKTKQFIVY
jgi:hypothetical protein